MIGWVDDSVARFWRQIVVGAVFIMIYFDVVGSVLLGLSVIFCRLLGCRMPTPSVVFRVYFLGSVGSHGVPRMSFSSFLVRQMVVGGVPRRSPLDAQDTGSSGDLLGTEKNSICTLFLDVRSLYSFFVGV